MSVGRAVELIVASGIVLVGVLPVAPLHASWRSESELFEDIKAICLAGARSHEEVQFTAQSRGYAEGRQRRYTADVETMLYDRLANAEDRPPGALSERALYKTSVFTPSAQEKYPRFKFNWIPDSHWKCDVTAQNASDEILLDKIKNLAGFSIIPKDPQQQEKSKQRWLEAGGQYWPANFMMGFENTSGIRITYSYTVDEAGNRNSSFSYIDFYIPRR